MSLSVRVEIETETTATTMANDAVEARRNTKEIKRELRLAKHEFRAKHRLLLLGLIFSLTLSQILAINKYFVST